MNPDTEAATVRTTISQWFVARKQEALEDLLSIIWNQLSACDVIITDILRSFAKYLHRLGLNRAVTTLEDVAIELEESSDRNNPQL